MGPGTGGSEADLSDVETQVFDTMKKLGATSEAAAKTVDELRKPTHMTRNIIAFILESLLKKGVIVQVGEGDARKFFLK